MSSDLLARISGDPAVMVGKPVIRGTRIPVSLIVGMLADGRSEREILDDYPRLEPDDICAALAYAAGVLEREIELPMVATPHAGQAIRFLVDESSGLALARHLREQSHDVLAAAEIMPRADDRDVLDLAVRDRRVLISVDRPETTW